MITGLYELIVSIVAASIVYYIGSIVPSPIIKSLAGVIAVIIAVLGLLTFLHQFIH